MSSGLPFPTFEPIHPIQLQRWREMTFMEKAQLVENAYQMSRSLVRARLTTENPALPAPEIEAMVGRHFLYAST
jgi:hypothetical protein